MRRGPFQAALAVLGLLALMILAARCRAAEAPSMKQLRVKVLASFPHDPSSYTQGLLWYADTLFESTGQYGESRLVRLQPADGAVIRQRALPEELFGEGLARIDNRLVQLTWREGRALVYDLETLEPLDEWAYDGEGWGLCHDGAQLWMSDGSARLLRRDVGDFSVLGELQVTLGGRPVAYLNELECAEGWIYANVYQTDRIVQIDPVSGRVVALIDAAGLLSADERRRAEVLNGIAYDPAKETFYLTGKLWPRLFEVTFE